MPYDVSITTNARALRKENASGGESISFKVTAKKRLKLSGLTVITDSGEKIEFKEEDITVDSTGVYSISNNKFTMPYENVTIEARWGVINPETGRNIVFITASVFALILLTFMTYLKRIEQ